MAEYHSVEYLLGFFLMVVWIVPFGFFISLAANESVLPGSGLAGANGSAGSLGGGQMPSGAYGTPGWRKAKTRKRGAAGVGFRKGAVGEGLQEERVSQRNPGVVVQGA